ncbi:MAG: hypothetical protein EHM70_21125 [Chloroflexota bacterium]|nr:MAG: hypothetical protein EHM70_21125 [Chloroflexota bacterium]
MDTVEKTTPLLKNERLWFGVLFFTGFSFCTRGIGQAPVYGWTHPISLLGILLGMAALLLGVSVLFRLRVGWIKSDRAAIWALLGIMAVKVFLAFLYPLTQLN